MNPIFPFKKSSSSSLIGNSFELLKNFSLTKILCGLQISSRHPYKSQTFRSIKNYILFEAFTISIN
uniref:Uncharacterized protein n=1 Tax=Arundo donax TaxID=35708 RepID=A0A0A9AGA6_ARUDO